MPAGRLRWKIFSATICHHRSHIAVPNSAHTLNLLFGMVVATPTKLAVIKDLVSHGFSYQEVSERTGLKRSTVGYAWIWLKKHNFDPKAKRNYRGAKKIMTPSKVLICKRAIRSGACRTASDVQRAHFPTVTPQTVRSALSREGL